MKRIFWTVMIGFCVFMLVDATAMAQRGGGRGGGARPGGSFSGGARPSGGFSGGSRPGGMPGNFRPSPPAGPSHALPGGNWGGNGNVVHHDFSGNRSPAARPGNLPNNVRPGTGDRPSRGPANWTEGNRPGADRPSRGPSDWMNGNRPGTNRPANDQNQRPNANRPRLPDLDVGNARKLLEDHGFSNSTELKKVLQEKGIHGPDDIKKTLTDRSNRQRDQFQKSLTDKGIDPSKIDRTKISDSVKKRIDNHGNQIVINKNQINVINRQFIDNHKNFVNNFHDRYNHWHDHYPNGWHPHFPPPPHAWWGPPPSWNRCWGWFAAGFLTGIATDAALRPIPYYYGTNIYYVDGMVYANGQPYVSSDEYYEQAQDLATSMPVSDGDNAAVGGAADQEPGPADQWLPLGTFAVLKDPDQKDSDRVLQLAVNKLGAVAGNLVDVKSDKAVELVGAVDPKTQRVAFHAKGNDEAIAECGLSNLTEDSLTLLLHVNKDKVEERTLVRLTDAEKEKE